MSQVVCIIEEQIAKNAHSKEFCATIEHITQVVLELSKKKEQEDFLKSRKLVGDMITDISAHEYTVKGLKIEIVQDARCTCSSMYIFEPFQGNI